MTSNVIIVHIIICYTWREFVVVEEDYSNNISYCEVARISEHPIAAILERAIYDVDICPR